ncbi:MAG: hypothetical protein V4596_07950 [Bdellovibrionota bacterium]
MFKSTIAILLIALAFVSTAKAQSAGATTSSRVCHIVSGGCFVNTFIYVIRVDGTGYWQLVSSVYDGQMQRNNALQ